MNCLPSFLEFSKVVFSLSYLPFHYSLENNNRKKKKMSRTPVGRRLCLLAFLSLNLRTFVSIMALTVVTIMPSLPPSGVDLRNSLYGPRSHNMRYWLISYTGWPGKFIGADHAYSQWYSWGFATVQMEIEGIRYGKIKQFNQSWIIIGLVAHAQIRIGCYPSLPA